MKRTGPNPIRIEWRHRVPAPAWAVRYALTSAVSGEGLSREVKMGRAGAMHSACPLSRACGKTTPGYVACLVPDRQSFFVTWLRSPAPMWEPQIAEKVGRNDGIRI